MIRFTDREFEMLTEYVRSQTGIDLSKKRVLAECRLSGEMEKRGIPSVTELLKQVEKDKTKNLQAMVFNRLTTNYTFFLREPKHFEFLEKVILPELMERQRMLSYKIWCAGCSSGEECYTLSMLFADYQLRGGVLPAYRIWGTDIAEPELQRAKEARYPILEIEQIPSGWRRFCREEKDGRFFTLTPNIRNHVGFQRANLLDGRISQGPFDLIFCRNVMIYFDEESRKKLLNRLYRLLKPGGYLFLGHTELLTKNHEQFQYVYPAVYRKAVEETG